MVEATLAELLERSTQAVATTPLTELTSCDCEPDSAPMRTLADRVSREPHRFLWLPDTRTLTPGEVARIRDGSWIRVSVGLTSLRDNAGDCLDLASWQTEALHLADLAQLDPACAAALAPSSADSIELGVKSLDPATAEALARWDGRWGDQAQLLLPRLEHLDGATASALAGFPGKVLILYGLTSLDPEGAAALGAWAGGLLRLGSLDPLELDVATGLATFEGGLSLGAVKALEPDVASVLGGSNAAWLSLHGLEALDADVATALVAFRGSALSLDAVPTVDVATARALAAWPGAGLNLAGAAPGAEALRVLAGYGGDELRIGVTTLDRAGATALAARAGRRLRLVALDTLDPDAARALAAWGGEELHVALPALGPATAEALATWAGDRLALDEVTALDAPTAAALAKTSARALSLRGLASLEPEGACALAIRPRGGVELPRPLLDQPCGAEAQE